MSLYLQTPSPAFHRQIIGIISSVLLCASQAFAVKCSPDIAPVAVDSVANIVEVDADTGLKTKVDDLFLLSNLVLVHTTQIIGSDWWFYNTSTPPGISVFGYVAPRGIVVYDLQDLDLSPTAKVFFAFTQFW